MKTVWNRTEHGIESPVEFLQIALSHIANGKIVVGQRLTGRRDVDTITESAMHDQSPEEKKIHEQRREYDAAPLDEATMADCPFRQFEEWYQTAVKADLLEPNAMVVSTVDERGQPTQRTVLLKYFDTSGFVFFTNLESRKARHISQNSRVSLLFPWLPLQRQLAVEGRAERVSTLESMKYFASRPRGSQLGAWVSKQSTVITSRSLLENKLAELKQKFASGEVPWPSFWGGFRVIPERMEFWQGQPNRLHDRIEYLAETPGVWRRQRLSP